MKQINTQIYIVNTWSKMMIGLHSMGIWQTEKGKLYICYKETPHNQNAWHDYDCDSHTLKNVLQLGLLMSLSKDHPEFIHY